LAHREDAVAAALAARHEVDAVAHLVGLGHDVAPRDERTARGRKQQGRQDLDAGGLARAVRSEESEHLAALDPQIDAGERDDFTAAAAGLEYAAERECLDRGGAAGRV